MGHAVARNAIQNLRLLDLCSTCQRFPPRQLRYFHAIPPRRNPRRHSHAHDPRLEQLGKVIRDEYAVIRDHYGTFIVYQSTHGPR